MSIAHMENLKQGKDITLENGMTIENHRLTLDPDPPKPYAFCSDTAYLHGLAQLVKGISCLYHEAILSRHSPGPRFKN